MQASNEGAAPDLPEAARADGRAASDASDGSGGTAGLLLIAGLTVVWGCNWPFIKIALSEAPVWWFRAGCVIAGGAGLLAISAASGARLRPRAKEVPKLIGCSVFAIIGWHVFTGYGVANMGAGRASIIAYTMPLWAALFSVVLIGERLRASTIAGLAFGAGGLAALIGPDIVAIETTPLGAIFMLAAAASWGLGTVLFKRTEWSTPVAVTTGWLLVIGAVAITAGAFVLEPFPDVARFKMSTWIAIAYVFLLPMIFGQWAFYKIVNLFSPTTAAVATMMVPVIGVISSSLMIPEPVGERDLIALALISAALFSVLVLPTLGRRGGGQ